MTRTTLPFSELVEHMEPARGSETKGSCVCISARERDRDLAKIVIVLSGMQWKGQRVEPYLLLEV